MIDGRAEPRAAEGRAECFPNVLAACTFRAVADARGERERERKEGRSAGSRIIKSSIFAASEKTRACLLRSICTLAVTGVKLLFGEKWTLVVDARLHFRLIGLRDLVFARSYFAPFISRIVVGRAGSHLKSYI